MAINSAGVPPSAFESGAASPLSAYEQELIGYANEAVQEADTFLRGQEGYSKIVPTMQAIMGVNIPIRPTYLSHTASNEIGRLAEIIRSELTDVKPSAEYKTHNDHYASDATNLGKMWTSWYYNQGIDLRYGSAIDYALVSGTGYAYQYWNKFSQDIDVMAYDSRDVLPIRPIDNSIQSCMGVILRREMTVNAVKAMFPQAARRIKEDRQGTTSKLPESNRENVMNQRIGVSTFERAQMSSQPQEKRGPGIPVVDLYYMYLNDSSTNTSSRDVMVGDFRADGTPANNYSQVVKAGDPLYPRKRLVIFTKTAVLYDGPSLYWHGLFPVSKYSLTPWSWSWLGSTPLWDCLPLQDTLNRCLRIMDDHIQKTLRPPVFGDKTSVGESEIKLISEMMAKPGAFWRQNPMGKGVEIGKVEPLDQIITTMIEFAVQKMAERCGVQDMSGLLKLGQMPEAQTVDKIMFATRPEIRSRSRMLEVFYREQGKMFMYNAAQFYTARRKFALLGREGLTHAEFDFDPQTFIPVESNDPRPRLDIAEEHLRNFSFYVAPSSLLRSAQTTDQMMALTLFRDGAIDPQTLLERLDFPNVKQVMERLAQKAQAEAALGMIGGAGDSFGPPMGGDPQGRPPSGQHPPTQRSDGDMSES